MAAQSKAIDEADLTETVRGSEPDQAREVAKNDTKNDLAAENASLRERLMRALAETENTRRQGDRRAEDAQRYAITNFAREMLDVVDNLRRAIEASAAKPDKGETGGLVGGVVATDQLLAKILRRFGVEPINALNAPFDPAKHEAVMEVDDAGKPPRSVVEVLEDGYTLYDRLLRPARVAVTKSQPSPPQAKQP
ncbi:nucleotide exchange factor GrpE [Bradyrhizobium genosp. P]|uniref:nucleotide exchange factor GrpE n=1 Tax=Bradyrhizobium genosp. P TaxID=83641 RepID=UPI003CF51DC3